MKKIIAALAALFRERALQEAKPGGLDYGQAIPLDAEDLAETGIGQAYERLKPALQAWVMQPAELVEHEDADRGCYGVSCGGKTYDVCVPELPDAEGAAWGRATHAFFDLVNRQLEDAPVRLYALNGGNDLFGIFLTKTQAEDARKALPGKSDWPYLPTPDHPYYGEYH